MKHKYLYIFFFLFLVFCLRSYSQSDSLKILTYTNFLSLVKTNHPVAKQTEIITQSANAVLLNAKGNFDPKLFYDFNQKEFEGKNYWTLSSGGISIPTWFGIELKGGLEQNSGLFLNPEYKVPQQGLIYSQISLPIAQGLFIDERRATLKQAKIFIELSDAEKNILLNNILFNAGNAYWDWYEAYQNLQIYKEAVEVSDKRLKAVISSAKLGDRPYIDTVEATIQFQERIVNLQQSELEFTIKGLMLSNYLWLENDIPIEITNLTIPNLTENLTSNEDYIKSALITIDSLVNTHPELKVYDFKLKQLDIEQRLKKEKLKPILNVNYNPLFDQTNNIYTENYFVNNYKIGLNFSFPIFLRKERGDLKLTQLKVRDTQYESQNKQNQIKNKVRAQVSEYQTSEQQIETYTTTVANYRRLLDSEKTLFNTGESSLFMVNSREMAYINAQIKLNKYINKNQKAILSTLYSIGQLYTLNNNKN